MYRFNAEDPGQSLYTPTTVGVIVLLQYVLNTTSPFSGKPVWRGYGSSSPGSGSDWAALLCCAALGICVRRSPVVNIEMTSVASDLSTRCLNNVRSGCVCSGDNMAWCWRSTCSHPHISVVWYGWEILDSVTSVIVCLLALLELLVLSSEFL